MLPYSTTDGTHVQNFLCRLLDELTLTSLTSPCLLTVYPPHFNLSALSLALYQLQRESRSISPVGISFICLSFPPYPPYISSSVISSPQLTPLILYQSVWLFRPKHFGFPSLTTRFSLALTSPVSDRPSPSNNTPAISSPLGSHCHHKGAAKASAGLHKSGGIEFATTQIHPTPLQQRKRNVNSYRQAHVSQRR